MHPPPATSKGPAQHKEGKSRSLHHERIRSMTTSSIKEPAPPPSVESVGPADDSALDPEENTRVHVFRTGLSDVQEMETRLNTKLSRSTPPVKLEPKTNGIDMMLKRARKELELQAEVEDAVSAALHKGRLECISEDEYSGDDFDIPMIVIHPPEEEDSPPSSPQTKRVKMAISRKQRRVRIGAPGKPVRAVSSTAQASSQSTAQPADVSGGRRKSSTACQQQQQQRQQQQQQQPQQQGKAGDRYVVDEDIARCLNFQRQIAILRGREVASDDWDPYKATLEQIQFVTRNIGRYDYAWHGQEVDEAYEWPSTSKTEHAKKLVEPGKFSEDTGKHISYLVNMAIKEAEEISAARLANERMVVMEPKDFLIQKAISLNRSRMEKNAAEREYWNKFSPTSVAVRRTPSSLPYKYKKKVIVATRDKPVS